MSPGDIPSGESTVGRNNRCVRSDGRTDGRTVVRVDKSDIITKPKFFAFTGNQILLAMGIRAAPPARRAPLIIIFIEMTSPQVFGCRVNSPEDPPKMAVNCCQMSFCFVTRHYIANKSQAK